MKNLIIKKWKEMGLLSGNLNEKDKKLLSNYYEIAQIYLINEKNIILKTLFIPIISRIYRETKNKNINIKDLYINLKNYIKILYNNKTNMTSDEEAKLVFEFTEKYIGNINKENYKIEKWGEIGFLKFVKVKDMLKLCELYNKALFLLGKYNLHLNENSSQYKQILIFPAIQKIYSLTNKTDINIEDLLKKLTIFFKINKGIIDKYQQSIDGETELLTQFCDEYIEKLKQ